MIYQLEQQKSILILFLTPIFFLQGLFFVSHESLAYGECSEYGLMARYNSLTNSCECISGYIFDDDVFGKTKCVSATNVCHSELGYNSRYNTLNRSCECSYGYIMGKDSLGKTQCVSPDSVCKDKLGFNARHNVLSDKCECNSGYVFDGSRCTLGSVFCNSEYGINSTYSYLSDDCECDEGYTLDDSNRCVEKQNNVYFILEELDTEEKKAIIKSEYDYSYHLISYGIGCYDFSFERYLGQRIVINLGTDFDLDAWDRIVLQEDDESCYIVYTQHADSSTSLESDDEYKLSNSDLGLDQEDDAISPTLTQEELEAEQSEGVARESIEDTRDKQEINDKDYNMWGIFLLTSLLGSLVYKGFKYYKN